MCHVLLNPVVILFRNECQGAGAAAEASEIEQLEKRYPINSHNVLVLQRLSFASLYNKHISICHFQSLHDMSIVEEDLDEDNFNNLMNSV